MRISLALTTFVIAGLLLKCAFAEAKNHRIKMVSDWNNGRYYFEPKELTVDVRDTVTWVNMQDHGHNVISEKVPKGAKKFKSPMLYQKGKSWTLSLDRPGVYTYACSPHSNLNMKGKILARADSSEHSGHDHAASGDVKAVNKGIVGQGTINGINLKKNSINITHEPIPSIGWPKMTMDLSVSKRVDLKSFNPMDEVMFTLKLGRDKVYRIVEMHPSEHSHE